MSVGAMTICEDELWLMSFYRVSEISGSLFFGRLAKTMKPGRMQIDMTKHFSDEANHAWLWTECIEKLGFQPMKVEEAYQDQYIAEAGMPVNVMEVLAITQVFEQRVLRQYTMHKNIANLNPIVLETLGTIMKDEEWHIKWIRGELRNMEGEYGRDNITDTLKRFQEADERVYTLAMEENAHRIEKIIAFYEAA
ncbi:MAG: ferritin-like domain-containing protein [Alphaproteobacteria bacterium]|nr:ferritin-like domain-containing protein [Alphaproteobacteria bacterium]